MTTRAIRPASAQGVTDGGATETVVLTLTGVSTASGDDTVSLFGLVNLTIGTSGTGATVKVRRGTDTSGTEVGTATTDTVVATDKYTIPVEVSDTPGAVNNQSYVVTVTETAATADGTVNYAHLGGFIDSAH